MTQQTTQRRTELAHRSSNGIDVALLWAREDGEDKTVVRVRDEREDTAFEIPTEPNLALDVYYHPFAYTDLAIVDDEGRALAA
jgi:hypothetical protein